jgi:addiction module HigA family antidote
MTDRKPRLAPARPANPGEILRDFLEAQKTTQDELARAMGVSRFSINQIVNGRRAVTAEMALRLSRVTRTTAELWLDLQRRVDLFDAHNALSDVLSDLSVLPNISEQSALVVDDGDF